MIIKVAFISLIFLAFSGTAPAWAQEYSNGYQMALIDATAQNPKSVLLNRKITPADSAVREFEWIIETLRNRCHSSNSQIIMTLVESWRTIQRGGHKVTLLEFSRKVADYSKIASQAMRNKKMDILKLTLKVIHDNYSSRK